MLVLFSLPFFFFLFCFGLFSLAINSVLAYDGAHGLYIVRFSFCYPHTICLYENIKVPAATFEYNTCVDTRSACT